MIVITHLTDILVANTADLLDVGGALGDTLERVTGKDELILNVGGGSNVDVGLGSHAANVLLTEEVTIEKLAKKSLDTYFKQKTSGLPGNPYRISISARPVSWLGSMLTLMGKWA